MASFRDVIALWQSREAMASDIRASASAVSKWWQRDSIPSEWWAPIVESVTGRGAGVSADLLMELASRKVGNREPAEVRP